MIDVRLLKSEIVKNGMTQGEFCKRIEMSQSSFVRKMRKKCVTTEDAEKMITVLKIKDPAPIFFATDLTR